MTDQTRNDGSRGHRDEEPFPGARILRARSPKAVLDRLIDGDPLGIEERVTSTLAREGWALRPSSLVFRVAARVAFDAMAYRGRPALEAWLAGRIERAVADAVVDQLEEERMQIPPEDPDDAAFHALVARRLRLEDGLGRLACTILNRLPRDVRRTVRAVAVEGRSVNRWVAEGNGPPARVERHLSRARRAITEAVEARRDEGLGS